VRHWLMKTEPDTYSIDDLERDGRTGWEGVRNYMARNWMRDDVQVGDLVLIYHSNADPLGVVGIARVARAAYPDPFQFQKKSPYYDETSPKDDPRGVTVDVEFVEKLDVVTLAELKAEPGLAGMEVTRKGSRLSVHPVDAKHFEKVVEMGRRRVR
jgi:predicted RNA-binding protein with PUA-like domain